MTVGRLFDGAHLRADLVDNGHNRLMVSFDWRRIGRTGFTRFDPNPNFANGGFDQLKIATAENDWFINADTRALERALTGIADRYDGVHAIGFSMGGFGAFRFSQVLAIDTVVAVSPQVSICQAIAPFEWRYRTEARTFDGATGDLREFARSGLGGHILIDDLNAADLAHAKALQAICPGVRLVRLTAGGHPATGVLKQARRAGRVQKLAMDPAGGLHPLLADHRAARRSQSGYWALMGKALRTRHPDCADRADLHAKVLK